MNYIFIKIFVFFLLSAFSFELAKGSETSEEPFIEKVIHFVHSIANKKKDSCPKVIKFKKFAIESSQDYRVANKKHCSATCKRSVEGKDYERRVSNGFDIYNENNPLKSLRAICKREGDNFEIVESSLSCRLALSYGGSKKEPIPHEVKKDYKGYKCVYDCWQPDGGLEKNISIDGKPFEDARIYWQMVQGCRKEKKLFNIDCGFY